MNYNYIHKETNMIDLDLDLARICHYDITEGPSDDRLEVAFWTVALDHDLSPREVRARYVALFPGIHDDIVDRLDSLDC